MSGDNMLERDDVKTFLENDMMRGFKLKKKGKDTPKGLLTIKAPDEWVYYIGVWNGAKLLSKIDKEGKITCVIVIMEGESDMITEIEGLNKESFDALISSFPPPLNFRDYRYIKTFKEWEKEFFKDNILKDDDKQESD